MVATIQGSILTQLVARCPNFEAAVLQRAEERPSDALATASLRGVVLQKFARVSTSGRVGRADVLARRALVRVGVASADEGGDERHWHDSDLMLDGNVLLGSRDPTVSRGPTAPAYGTR